MSTAWIFPNEKPVGSVRVTSIGSTTGTRIRPSSHLAVTEGWFERLPPPCLHPSACNSPIITSSSPAPTGYCHKHLHGCLGTDIVETKHFLLPEDKEQHRVRNESLASDKYLIQLKVTKNKGCATVLCSRSLCSGSLSLTCSSSAETGDGNVRFASSPLLPRGGSFPEVVCCALLPEAHCFNVCQTPWCVQSDFKGLQVIKVYGFPGATVPQPNGLLWCDFRGAVKWRLVSASPGKYIRT